MLANQGAAAVRGDGPITLIDQQDADAVGAGGLAKILTDLLVRCAAIVERAQLKRYPGRGGRNTVERLAATCLTPEGNEHAGRQNECQQNEEGEREKQSRA